MEPNPTNTELPEATAEEAVVEEDPREALEKRFRGGASWFYWVAGLSLINSAVVLFNGEWGFLFGLGATQVVDAIGLAVAEESGEIATAVKVASFAANLLIVGFVALMGWLAHKRLQWVFVVGLVLYAFDALIFLVAGDFLGLAFHGWVFFAVTSGYLACRKLAALDSPTVAQAFSPA